MDYRADLLTLARAYGAATNRQLATVSTLVRKDGKFFHRIDAGAGCTMETYQFCMQWFSNHWPDTAAWPEAIARPQRAEPIPQQATGTGD